MRVIDFVTQVAEATDHSVDVIVNGVQLYDSVTGLVFSEKLYMEFNITKIEYSRGVLCITADLEKTTISEAILTGKHYANGRFLLYSGTLYFVDGFEITPLFCRKDLEEMFNL